MYSIWKAGAFLSVIAAVNAATHELIVGTFGTKVLYTLTFDDELLTLDLVGNTTVPVAGSWIALSVSWPWSLKTPSMLRVALTC